MWTIHEGLAQKWGEKRLDNTRVEQPTEKERDEIAQCLFENREIIYQDCETLGEMKRFMSEQAIAKFPKWMQGCPGYAGELFVMVWEGGPASITVLTRENGDGKMQLEANGELEYIKKGCL